MKGTNTFIGGLNQDNSPSKYQPNNYYYLLNGMIVTQTGLSTGSVTNELGNTISFSIPSTAPVYEITVADGYIAPSQLNITTSTTSYLVTLSGTTLAEIFDNITDDTNIQADITASNFNVYLNSGRIVIVGLDDLTSVTLTFGSIVLDQVCSAQTGLKICGLGTLENNIIVFTTENTDDAPVDIPSQIWELEFDEATETITNLSGNSLVPSVHLKYNNILNLSLANRVGEIIGRYENSKIRTVYFTDDYNFLRSLNLANPDTLAIAPQDLDVRADFTLGVPVVENIGTGSIPIGSTIQVGYRLKTINGTTTIIAPFSPPVPLGTDPNSGNYEDQKGAGFNTSGSRSITYTIDNIDTSYGFIEHIAILYQNKDVPEIYIFKEEKVPLNGTLTVTHDYTEELLPLTLTELNVINHPFICKTITSKRNKLVAANIKYRKVKIDYDARAFRFLQNGTCFLYNKQGITDNTVNNGLPLTSINLATANIPEEADCINPFNDESGTIFGTTIGDPTIWESSYQYKYQSNGTTLGGEGKNVSYTFTNKAIRAFNNVVSAAPFNSVSRDNATVLLDVTNDLQTTNDGMYADYKSPLRSAYLKGYKRGEVYRFGIVFFDKKGTPSMVNWIGDIRFPEVSEYNLGSGTNTSLDTKTLGIEFTVDISSVQTQISGFSIVRLERKEKDKTKLGTSLHIGFTNNTGDDSCGVEGLFGQTVDQRVNISGSNTPNTYILQDHPGIGNTSQFHNLFGLIFPKHQYNNIAFKDGDFLKEIGDYTTSAFSTYYNNAGDYTIGVFYRGYGYNTLSSYRRFLLDEIKTIDYLGHFPASDFSSISSNVNTFVNTSYAREGFFISGEGTPLGLGNKKLICLIDDTPPTGYNGNIKGNWANGIWNAGTSPGTPGTTYGGTFRIKPLDYCRFLVNQYGGASYESRASNTYISTGHFQAIDNTSATNQTAAVYGGDTFTLYNTDEFITMHWEAAGNCGEFDPEFTNNKLSCAVGFPCETDLNLAYKHDNTWNEDQDFSGNWTKTPYSYHTAYSQAANTIQQYISPAIIDTDTDEHPHQIIASEEKIDGEAFDAWRIFRPNDLIEVDGIYGEINKIVTFKDKVFFYQSRALGQVSIQDRAITQDTTGVEVVLGTGQVLDYYAYISTTTGTVHQFSVVITGAGVYHVDALSKKVGVLSDNPIPLSTIKGLSALFAENLDGLIRTTDQTLHYNSSTPPDSGEPALGVHGVYDKRNNRVIWTILNGKLLTLGQGTKLNPYYTSWVKDNITISYNELIQSFDSFKSYTPKLYLEHPNRFLSTDPDNMESAYIHNLGTRCEFYGTTYDTKITLLINTSPNDVKTLDVIEYLMDLKDSTGTDIPLETFNTLRIYNSHQDTGTLTLTPQDNIVRRIRTWRMNVLRDNSSNKPRLRDYHFFLELTYNNNNNKEMVLHDVAHYIRPSNF